MKMRQNFRQDSNFLSQKYSLFLAVSGSLSTLLISPFLNFDPINMVKLCALVIGAATILPVVVSKNFRGFRHDSKLNRFIVLITLALILIFFINLIINLENLSETAWGVFGRNNGVISYVALMVFFLAALRVSNEHIPLLLRTFRICGNIVLMYALIQIMGLDPFDWTGEGPFSTLGNLNFSAAFLAIHASYLIALALLDVASPWHTRAWFGIVAVVDMFVVWNTTSIQGLGIFGITIVLMAIRKLTLRNFNLLFPAVVVSLTAGAVVFLGSFGVGPLKLLRQETMLFRLDYWSAGISMLIKNPIFGIGMDSYGNYYREYRNEVAANRNYFDRITNTAHNIPIDVAAGAGVAAGLIYLTILLILIFLAMKIIFKSKRNTEIYISLLAIGFIFQQFVSINQIGLAAWGWILLGLLLSSIRSSGNEDSETITADSQRNHPSQKLRSKAQFSSAGASMPLFAYLFPALGFVLGVSLVAGPMSTDIRFLHAVRSGDVELQAGIARGFGGNQFLMENSLKAAVEKNDPMLIDNLATEVVERYPRSYYGWQVLAGLITRSREDRLEALAELKRLDPLNTEIPSEPLG